MHCSPSGLNLGTMQNTWGLTGPLLRYALQIRDALGDFVTVACLSPFGLHQAQCDCAVCTCHPLHLNPRPPSCLCCRLACGCWRSHPHPPRLTLAVHNMHAHTTMAHATLGLLPALHGRCRVAAYAWTTPGMGTAPIWYGASANFRPTCPFEGSPLNATSVGC